MSGKQRRLILVLISGGVLALATALMLYALKDTLLFFYGPSEAIERQVAPETRFRLGGLVAEGSWIKGSGGNNRFQVSDGGNTITVVYAGILPDLFREGQGVVTEGALNGEGLFIADRVLAKHDETYMPKEVAEALKKQGVWQGKAP